MKAYGENELPIQVLKWVVNAVDPQSALESTRPLKGSTSSTLHSISLGMENTVKHFVVRQFDNAEWLQKEPDLALHEAESLRYAAKARVRTPEIIAFDDNGSVCGLPTVLMTKLDGYVELKPDSMENWLNGLAEALVKIHVMDAEDFQWKYYTYNDIPTLETPSWTSVPWAWQKAIEIVKGPRPIVKECFIHRDYHPTNVLWNNGLISGVVDWVNACRGPAGVDVGHCRLNLAMLYDVTTADAFLSSYQRQAGEVFVYEPYWDLVSLIDMLFGPPKVYPGWEAFGVTGLTDKMMEERLDKYVESLVERVLG